MRCETADGVRLDAPTKDGKRGGEDLARILAIAHCPPFHRDPWFLAALAGAVPCWVFLVIVAPTSPMPWASLLSLAFLSVSVWQPAVEELLFRGFLQGQLHHTSWGRRAVGGFTLANGLTSVVFMAVHWLTHPPLWALAVLIPSLLFGAMRDRFRSLYPAIVLHSFYNAGYFLLTGIP